MGRDKGSLVIGDKPMISHILSTLNNEIDEAIIVLNNQDRIEKYRKFIEKYNYSFKITFVEDEIKNKGPLSGIKSGLKYTHSQYSLVLPCDNPYISKNSVNYLFSQIEDEYDCIVPYHDKDNKLQTSEPLHSIYSQNVVDKIEKLIKKDILHIKGLIETLNCKYVEIDNKKLLKEEFKNLNRPEDI